MVDVSINGSRAVFNVEGSHKLWAIKSRIEIPLTHIARARALQEADYRSGRSGNDSTDAPRGDRPLSFTRSSRSATSI